MDKVAKVKDPRARFVPELSKSLGRESELHDEGFEETQSLVSETMSSQDASSGNYETDAPDSSTRCSPANLSKLANSPVNYNNVITSKSRLHVLLLDKQPLHHFPFAVLDKRLSKDGSPLSLRKLAGDNSATSFLPKRSPSLKRDASASKIGEPNSTAKRILPLSPKTAVKGHELTSKIFQKVRCTNEIVSAAHFFIARIAIREKLERIRPIMAEKSWNKNFKAFLLEIRVLKNDLRQFLQRSPRRRAEVQLQEQFAQLPKFPQLRDVREHSEKLVQSGATRGIHDGHQGPDEQSPQKWPTDLGKRRGKAESRGLPVQRHGWQHCHEGAAGEQEQQQRQQRGPAPREFEKKWRGRWQHCDVTL